ncbi:MAG: hypothetical protein MUO31_02650 [Thermodesulfovibrionales bacterium]|nr:hypothetical protein [Thermodesulfovibrionales bacterium]
MKQHYSVTGLENAFCNDFVKLAELKAELAKIANQISQLPLPQVLAAILELRAQVQASAAAISQVNANVVASDAAILAQIQKILDKLNKPKTP